MGNNPEIAKEVGAAMQLARIKARATQKDIGHAVNRPRLVVGQWESGKRCPSISALAAWSEKTGFPVALRIGDTRISWGKSNAE